MGNQVELTADEKSRISMFVEGLSADEISQLIEEVESSVLKRCEEAYKEEVQTW